MSLWILNTVGFYFCVATLVAAMSAARAVAGLTLAMSRYWKLTIVIPISVAIFAFVWVLDEGWGTYLEGAEGVLITMFFVFAFCGLLMTDLWLTKRADNYLG